MRLLVDVGNTRIKAALESEGMFQALAAFTYAEDNLEDQLAAWKLPEGITAVWVASVGHADLCDSLDAWFYSRLGIHAYFPQSTAEACGVRNAYSEPARLGVDRWLGLIAAHADERAAIVVSAGTAATIDVVGADGQHLGGLITPGVSTQRRAMLDHTQVRANIDDGGLKLLGNSTDRCVTFGTLHAVAGYVDRIVERVESELAGPWCKILTGGDAELLAPELAGSWKIRPNLVIEGLSQLANHSAD